MQDTLAMSPGFLFLARFLAEYVLLPGFNICLRAYGRLFCKFFIGFCALPSPLLCDDRGTL